MHLVVSVKAYIWFHAHQSISCTHIGRRCQKDAPFLTQFIAVFQLSDTLHRRELSIMHIRSSVLNLDVISRKIHHSLQDCTFFSNFQIPYTYYGGSLKATCSPTNNSAPFVVRCLRLRVQELISLILAICVRAKHIYIRLHAYQISQHTLDF